MDTYPAVRDQDRPPVHPGTVIEDILSDLPQSKTEIASLLGISRQHLYDILKAKRPVSPDVAARLGKLFGNGAGLWLRIQAAYDAWHAERDVDVSNIPTLAVA